MDVSIIIPTFNESQNITNLIKKVNSVFNHNNIDGEILIIDDNSPDGTGEIAEKLSKKYKNIRVFHRREKLGLGSAYKFGFRQSKSPIVMEMDADLSHNPKYIPQFLYAMKDHDFAIGSRYIKGGGVLNWPIFRKMVSTIANKVAGIILGLDTNDVTTGYRAYRKDALDKINLDEITSSGYSFQVEILYRLKQVGCKLAEVPIIFVDRKYGESKLSEDEIFKFLFTVFRLKLKR